MVIVSVMTTDDSDWVHADTIPAPDSTRATPFTGVWRCDGEQYEPERHPTLIEATGERPRTPEAQVYGNGALLAQSAEDVAQWQFTDAGKARVEREASGATPSKPLRRAIVKRTRLTKEHGKRVRSLIDDEGMSRAEAVAWVLAFEVAS